MRLTYTLCSTDEGMTVGDVLKRRLCLSAALRAACWANDAPMVDDRPAQKYAKPAVGAKVCVELPAPPPMEVPVEHAPIRVLYEDDALLALDKPAGILVHPSHAQYTDTLLSSVLGYLLERGEAPCAHPMHRLDRGTSGIVLFAKHPHTQARWMDALSAGRVAKTYEAVVLGRFPAMAGVIDLPILRPAPPAMLRTVREDGDACRTEYQVLREFMHAGHALSRVCFVPHTGRTHQLRVHSLAVGCPLLGDRLYRTPESARISDALGLQAQLLHATQLVFPHPLTGETIRIGSHFARAQGGFSGE